MLTRLKLVYLGKAAHGDELAFLFDPHDVFGNRIETQLTTKRDKNARKNLINLIQNFAYFNSNSSNFKLDNTIVNPFSAQNSNFIKISDKVDFEKNFRFCQLSVFAVPLKSAQKTSCAFLSDGLKSLPAIPKIGGVLSGKPLGFK